MIVSYNLGNFRFIPQAPLVLKNFDPTQARPGSKEKMRVIRTRIKEGMPLHHPEDKKNIASVKWWKLIDESEEFSITPEDEKDKKGEKEEKDEETA